MPELAAASQKHMRVPTPGVNVPALDSIRGLAILTVMAYHFFLYGGMEPTLAIDRLMDRIGRAGWVGVDLFFVLSGFLITGILFDTRQKRNYFRNFYIRRVLRIFPLSYAVLLIVFLIIPGLVPVGAEYRLMMQDQGWFWTYLTNVSIALNGWGSFYAFGHFWSLAVEEQFYLFWPIIIYLFPRRTLLKLCVVTMIGSLLLRFGLGMAGYGLVAYVSTPARMDALALGAFLALVVRGSSAERLKLSRLAWPVLAIAGTATGVYFIWKERLVYGDFGVYTVGFLVIALLFGAFLVISITTPPNSLPGKFFNSPVLRFFGRYSYALYVFHHPVAIFLPLYGFSVQIFPTLRGSQLPGLLLFSIVAALISLALALASWHLLEARFLSLKRYFEYEADRQDMDPANYETAKV